MKLFIEYIRKKYFHANCSFVKSFLANQVWLGGGSNNIVKRIFWGCVIYTHFQGYTATQIMGSLPIEHTSMARPFSSVGLDFFGPFDTKCVWHRSTIHFSSYLCVFVCMLTRAAHLKFMSDLRTECFLYAFKWFMGHRGIPGIVCSDNAKMFVFTAKVGAS